VQPAGRLPRCVSRFAALLRLRAVCACSNNQQPPDRPTDLHPLIHFSGGLYSNCTDGHQQGSPLCAICEESFYAAGGVCKACGPKRTIQITVCFAIGLAMAAFFLLLYFFVRVGELWPSIE